MAKTLQLNSGRDSGSVLYLFFVFYCSVIYVFLFDGSVRSNQDESYHFALQKYFLLFISDQLLQSVFVPVLPASSQLFKIVVWLFVLPLSCTLLFDFKTYSILIKTSVETLTTT
ncbi:hypothetical protein L596_007810 [Steinernema carpocapsae]|uniref:Uncharacterized protein n=1 Tax=Steinernema carpocapsae TaxID=34508 RepID=A0A4U5PBJ0_STECR|nr:hypothetical protein L596_007810 [Steinernema carpocapsae]